MSAHFNHAITVIYPRTTEADHIAQEMDVGATYLSATGVHPGVLGHVVIATSPRFYPQFQSFFEYHVASPDGGFNFDGTASIDLAVPDIEVGLLLRDRQLANEFHNQVRGVFNMAKRIESGDYIPAAGAPTQLSYVVDTLEQLLQHFPQPKVVDTLEQLLQHFPQPKV